MSTPEIHSVNLSDVFSEKEIEELQTALLEKFCDCGYMNDMEKCDAFPAQYVENYLGESHGWICPFCKKYVQVG